MLLGALIDAGIPLEEVQNAINTLNIPACALEAVKVTENSLAATRIQIIIADTQPHRHLQDIEKIITSANLEGAVKEKSLEVFRCLAGAEAEVHGCNIEEVHFHEVGAVDALVDIVGVTYGFHYLGINNITCSPLPAPRG